MLFSLCHKRAASCVVLDFGCDRFTRSSWPGRLQQTCTLKLGLKVGSELNAICELLGGPKPLAVSTGMPTGSLRANAASVEVSRSMRRSPAPSHGTRDLHASSVG